MNSLSWLIYASEVFDRLGFVLGMSVCLSLFASIFMCAAAADGECSWKTPKVWFLCGVVGCGTAAIVLPSQKTIMMIAASEMGERVAKTDDARELYDLLRKRVREALSDKAKT